MAIHNINLRSKSLFRNVTLNVITPDIEDNHEDLKTLYLLHGFSDNESAWLMNTKIRDYAQKYNLIVVMPSVENSYYSNTKYKVNYRDFVTKDVVDFVQSSFRSSRKREDNYIVGNSMGGHGALKIALNTPEKFGHVCSFSGSNLIKKSYSTEFAKVISFEDIIGPIDEVDGSENDVKWLVDNLKIDMGITLCCGIEDFNLSHTTEFSEYLQHREINHDVSYPPGAHTWDFWDEQLEIYLEKIFQ